MRLRIIGLLVPLLLHLAACISSRCFHNADCAGDLVCDSSSGACIVPECRADEDCAARSVCERYRCVAGCRGDEDCAPPQRCVERRCAAMSGECPCALAPSFCGPDLNPRSPTAGREVCVPADFPAGLLLFFGSVSCGHCQADVAELMVRQAELVADGLPARLLWVQLPDRVVAPAELQALLPAEFVLPIVQDTPDLDIWGRYAASWYDAILVEAHGCRAEKFGPLEASAIAGAEGERIVSAWREAMDEACPGEGTKADAAGRAAP